MRLIDVFQLVKSGDLQPYFDFDGTLAPFTSIPSQARSQGEIAQHLASLDAELRAQGMTGILFVTGRTHGEMSALLDNKLPIRGGFEHGARLVLGDQALASPLGKNQLSYLNRIHESATAYCKILNSLYPGFDFTQLIERKTFSLALHWRALEAANRPNVSVSEISKKFHQLLSEGNDSHQEFKVMSGDMNYELHLKKIDKGCVIKQLHTLINKAGQRPVFFGDDFVGTDGAAANAVWSLGGFVVMVDNGKGRVDDFLINHPQTAMLKEGVHYLVIRGTEPQKQIDEVLKLTLAPSAVEKTYVTHKQGSPSMTAFSGTATHTAENNTLTLLNAL